MKKVNKSYYIKKFKKFQMLYKNIDKQYSKCEMIEIKYEVTKGDKSFIFIGKFFNGWEDYIGTCVGNRKNNFYINFTNSRFDPYRNISFYGTPEKIEGIYVGNSKRKYPNILSSKRNSCY
jgi:hypothetical protein